MNEKQVQQRPVTGRGVPSRLDPRFPILGPGQSYGSITDSISAISLENKTGKGWIVGFGVSFMLVMLLLASITWLLLKGPGVWGLNIPVAWGFAILNFVWWIGIGHAGTLISAVLLLFRQDWRTSINRFAEAMTLFAVACAGLFPALHTGRPWLDYWLFPYPNTMGMWPQWRSPLMWDVFAISTYGTVSLLFWYVGLIPDVATLRDRATNKVSKTIYGMMALGWRGAARHWKRYTTVYLILAGLATPLVVSVHSIVGLDFAVSVIPGWHTTIFPPYFVAGAIYSGFAMVLTCMIPLRRAYGLEGFITMRHVNNMAKVMLACGLVVAYGYGMEAFIAWYSGVPFEQYMMFGNRMTGPYWPGYWALILTNITLPQLLWFRRVRTNLPVLWVISIIVNVGMWLERFVIVVTSLHRDYMPSSWAMFDPSFWDWSLYAGTLGLFFALLFLFIRFLPVIAMTEMRELLHETHEMEHILEHQGG